MPFKPLGRWLQTRILACSQGRPVGTTRDAKLLRLQKILTCRHGRRVGALGPGRHRVQLIGAYRAGTSRTGRQQASRGMYS